MSSLSTLRYFHTLAYLAVFLLWGISLWNGTVKALLLAVWHGQMGEEDLALKTNYTGFPLLDYPIALLVAFFFYGTNGYDEGYQLFLLDAYSTLQSAFVWLYVESIRPGNQRKWINRPMIFGMLWQCFGAAISLPLYYAQHLDWVSQARITQVVDLGQARALPLSFILGALIPAVVGMAPTWLGPNVRSAEAHQTILAAWQPDPLWVSWIFMCTAHAGTRIFGRSADTRDSRRKAYWWVRTSYLVAAISSVLGHLYVMGRIMGSSSDAVSLVRMYVPFPLTGPSGMDDNIFARGPWLFLQYDLIIISLSSVSWAFLLLQQVLQNRRLSRGTLGLILLAGSLTIGPGATVSLALLVRENHLIESHEA